MGLARRGARLALPVLLALVAAGAGRAAAQPATAAAALPPSPIKGDEQAVLFPTAAERSGDGWVVPVHGWVFEPEDASVWRGGTIRLVRTALDLDEADPRRTRFTEIARWFMVDNERGKRVPVRIGRTVARLPATGADGHTRQRVKVAAAPGQEWVTIEARARDGRTFLGRAQLLEPRGLSVVSDLDDTIKVTEVLRGKRRILERTFLEPFEAVPGMASRYEAWRAGGAAFHYVSASPWHLYPALADWMAGSGFPAGTFHLRSVRLKDRRAFELLRAPRTHKLTAIGELIRRFPGRTFVLVGDSGESDPEIYGELARRHPRQVRAIAIRRLPGDRWSADRQRRAFGRVKAQVILFRAADELPALAELTR